MPTYGYLNTHCMYCSKPLRWEAGVWYPSSEVYGDPTCFGSGTKAHIPATTSWVPMPDPPVPVPPPLTPICLACGYPRNSSEHLTECTPSHNLMARNCVARYPGSLIEADDEWCGTCA